MDGQDWAELDTRLSEYDEKANNAASVKIIDLSPEKMRIKSQ